ncbi:DNA repair protein XRCC3 X-ray repair cross-complementing protein 3 [Collichthys lucidus]|uniref:DNA repair protein XRCC3 X-ray repair cross-complementing protein 3 n=1 Tax=Collichthys lucidus TaxID=240159 RepID=A0A4U5TU69_COLLU|nr:DNA repair protein XRCC3 X-ray repair cross-complementing protein 3 [Collichthys lucidus]TKS65104.1 DNA repair protein XRCC3 X-ray repair cross-complementing protein 3 [Collichthys lucidus]
MDWKHLEMSPKIRAGVRRAKLRSVSDVLCVSGPDLQRLTRLSRSDVQELLTAAATACRRHPPVPALQLLRGECRRLESGLRLSVGCPVLDELLRGGLPVGGVTELSGESGAGKTQLALQLCLSVLYPPQYGGLNSGAVYICTEDSFPIRRLQQLIREQSELRSDVPSSLIRGLRFSDHVYIEHAADLDSLQVCLSRRVPLLLARGLVRLLVVDSVAALFRCEFQAADWLERTKQLLSFSSTLHHLSLEFTTPVLCINQVTNVFDSSGDSLGPLSSNVSPALGLAWANQVMVRLMMRRLHMTVARGDQCSVLRRLEVMFAPHLARDGRNVAVWREGVQGVSDTQTDT